MKKILLPIFLLVISCSKDGEEIISPLQTNITFSNIISVPGINNVQISSTYEFVYGTGYKITKKGVEIDNDKYYDNISSGDSILVDIEGLESNKLYSYKVFVESQYGQYESSLNDFTTESGFENTIQLGNQIWYSKNLSVKEYVDGTSIPQVQDPVEWSSLNTAAWCYYNNDPSNENEYGILYNWYAVMGIVDDETRLNPSLRKRIIENGKPAIMDEWLLAKMNSISNLNIVKSGMRDVDGSFTRLGQNGYSWTSTGNNDVASSIMDTYNFDYQYSKRGLALICLMKQVVPDEVQSKIDALPSRTEIPDVKFEEELISYGLDDVLDGFVETQSIATAGIFRAEHSGISDFTGIEKFLSLEFLSLWDNNISSINVSTLTQLKVLGLGENPNLETVDLSNNKELIEIAFQQNSTRLGDDDYPYGKTAGFTSLDLSNNVKLKRIYAWGNRLEELDVSMLVDLEDLWLGNSAVINKDITFGGNYIKQLDLSNNPRLNVITLGAGTLEYLNVKGTANNGLPRTLVTKGNPDLFEIIVDDAEAAYNRHSNHSEVWYLKDDFTEYVEE